MIRVNKTRPCPVCGKHDWCGISEDGNIAICMRVESGKAAQNGGYIHRLSETVPPPVRKQKKPDPKPARNIEDLHSRYRGRMTKDLCGMLAIQLGVSTESLEQLGVGYDGRNYSFPMFDAKDRVIGIKLRAASGKKFCVKGSRLGIYWPASVSKLLNTPLLICEGESDCAALLTMGYDAIGRPSCCGGVDIISEFLKLSYRDVVIVADKDTPKVKPDGSKWRPGIDGAIGLARQIKKRCKTLKIISPAKAKDIRQWLNDGATKDIVNIVIKNTRYYRG